ncbi:F0F1 ATP synthase subunit B family protein [Kitasatospora sp. CB01950]|uniref:F0F1 ATP synthase subunit B family protein n=1 Tax=Kitasatospora sp. CB01950 TaxID=1703930 RepID=UPI00093B2B26|nr:hypothetical protein [Kitasatospora sp. CB01950]OKJ13970.1 ATP synthase F0 subunit B [Kitasatospora sp. CB01950]
MGPLEPNVPELILGLIVFFLLFAVLGKVILPRIERTLAERHDKTDGGLVRAEAARAEAERIRDEFQAELSAARHEAAAIRQTAAEEGAALIAALRAEGLQQREQLVAEVHVQLAADKVLAEAELREDVIKVATELASRVVGEPLTDLPSTRAIAEEYRNRATV